MESFHEHGQPNAGAGGGCLSEADLPGKRAGNLCLSDDAYTGNPAELLKVLNRNPDCAFLVFLGEQEISETFAKEIVECGNAMVSVPARPDSAQNCRLMRNNGLLYAVHAGYGEEDADRMLDDSWLKKQLFLHPQCAFICADGECRREIRQKVYDHVVDVRMRQKYPVLLMEVREDLQMIDHIISEKRI